MQRLSLRCILFFTMIVVPGLALSNNHKPSTNLELPDGPAFDLLWERSNLTALNLQAGIYFGRAALANKKINSNEKAFLKALQDSTGPVTIRKGQSSKSFETADKDFRGALGVLTTPFDMSKRWLKLPKDLRELVWFASMSETTWNMVENFIATKLHETWVKNKNPKELGKLIAKARVRMNNAVPLAEQKAWVELLRGAAKRLQQHHKGAIPESAFNVLTLWGTSKNS